MNDMYKNELHRLWSSLQIITSDVQALNRNLTRKKISELRADIEDIKDKLISELTSICMLPDRKG